jgi:S-DNA-T family DNA segregation ATPase FtsK/SpoIIIE
MPPEVLTPHIKESQIIKNAPMMNKPSIQNTLIETPIKVPILPNSTPSTNDLLSSYVSSSNVTINQLTPAEEGSTTNVDETTLEPVQAESDLINTESTTSDPNKFNKYWSKSSSKEDLSLKTDSQINNLVEFKADPDVDKSKKLNNLLLNSASVSTSWKLPDMNLLSGISEGGISNDEIRDTANTIKNTFADYKIEIAVEKVRPGPTVTMYGIQPGWVRKVKRVKSRDEDGNLELDVNGKPAMVQQEEKTRVSVDSILRREKDLSLALKTPSLRIETPVMGESLLGIEVPNHTPSLVALKNVMESAPYTSLAKNSHLPVALGKGSDGEEVSFDLSNMPHLLIAGATGSGKSVCINAIITGLIMEKDPSEMQLLLIDPKRVELTPYNGIPHLMTPVIVENDKVVGILKGLIQEMMNRYRRMEETGVRNIASFNSKGGVKMPYIVVAIDELADLMMTAAFDIEQSICRLAQLGRATGIHLIVATQRPSVDVITGLIKANFPSRISFAVTSQIDSRTILDSMGAERLLGRGDMLYQPIDATRPARVQNVFIGDEEIGDIVHHWSSTPRGYKAEIDLNVFNDENSDTMRGSDPIGANTQDELFEKAMNLAQKHTKMSTSLLQRRLRIGYPRAARLMDELEDMGVVGPSDGSKSRDVLSST